MNHAFPPAVPPDIGTLAFGANALLLLLALAMAFGLFRTRDYQPRWTLVLRRGLGFSLIAGVCCLGLAFEGIRLSMALYFLFGWLVVAPTLLISLIVQVRGRTPTPRFVLGWLAAISLGVILCMPGISIA